MFRARTVVVRTYASGSSYPKNSIRVPVDSSAKNSLCVHCKYYLPPTIYGMNIKDMKKGFCEKSGMMHLVDGSIEYEKAETYREYTCKGSYFEKKESDKPDKDDPEVLYT